jgi:hypothetical protein
MRLALNSPMSQESPSEELLLLAETCQPTNAQLLGNKYVLAQQDQLHILT